MQLPGFVRSFTGNRRTRAALRLSANIVFALFNTVLGIAFTSPWFLTVSAYYIVLSVMRFCILRFCERELSLPDKVFIRRFCKWMFVLMAAALSVTVFLTVKNDIGRNFHEIIMITIALYAFTKITLAIIKFSKKKQNDADAILARISLADASVSIFSLQRSMLVSFKGMSVGNIRIFNLLTGIGMCAIVFILGIIPLTLHINERKETQMAKSKLVKATEKVAKGTKAAYDKIEGSVVGAYKNVEEGVVGAYTKIEDAFVEKYLAKDGESVEDAKNRLKGKN